MRIVLTAALVVLLAPAAFCQGRIVFGETSYDFGQITEGTQVTHVFTFRNEGDEAFKLTRALASCGCTTPEWTREPIAPGDSGRIKVVYDSKGRPGRFHKTIAVSSTAEPDLAILEIEGVVVEELNTGVRQGDLLVAADSHTFSTVAKGGRLAHTFLVKNVGTDPMTFREMQSESDAVQIEWPRDPLSTNEIARISVLLDTEHLETGPYSLGIRLTTTDSRQPIKTLTLNGRVDAVPPR